MAQDDAPSMPSYACILRAYEYRRTFEDALHAPAMACLKEAVLRDPEYADAWAMLGWLHLDAVRMDLAPTAERPAEMAAAFECGVACRRTRAEEPACARGTLRHHVLPGRLHDSGRSATRGPGAQSLRSRHPCPTGWRLAVRGNREGLDYLEQAIARSANPPGWYSQLIAVYAYLDGDYVARPRGGREIRGRRVGRGPVIRRDEPRQARRHGGGARCSWPPWPQRGRCWGATPLRPTECTRQTTKSSRRWSTGLRDAGWTPPEDASQ